MKLNYGILGTEVTLGIMRQDDSGDLEAPVAPPDEDDAILLESGDYVLLENADRVLME